MEFKDTKTSEIKKYKKIGVVSSSSPPSSEKICDVDYSSKLKLCTPYKCYFVHPFGDAKMKREIIGKSSGKCQTTEEMPNNGRMDCNFSMEALKNLSEYYARVSKTKTVESSSVVDLKNNKTSTVQKFDGEAIDKDPLNQAMQDGSCSVAGY